MKIKKEPPPMRGQALKIALIYLCIGALWILFSDQLVSLFFSDGHSITLVQTIKGWFYVLASAILIFFLILFFFNKYKATREKLDRSSEFHLDILNRFRQPAFKTDAIGQADFFNRSWMEFFNTSQSLDIDNKWFRYISNADKDSFSDGYRNAVLMMAPFETQIKMEVPGKGLRRVFLQTFPYNNPEGFYAGLIGIISDITDTLQKEEKLELESDFFKRAIDNIPFPVFVKDIEGRFLVSNIEFGKHLGLNEGQIRGKTVFDLFAPTQAGIFFEKDNELINSGGSQEYETRIQYPDGKERDVLFNKTVFYKSDKTLAGIIGIYFDISNRSDKEKAIEERIQYLSEKNAELESYVYAVSYDVKNPVLSIKGLLEQLKDHLEEMNPRAVHSDIKQISEATDKLRMLSDELLDISKSGRKKKTFELFRAEELISDVLHLLKASTTHKNISVNIKPALPSILGDRAGLKEVFFHLIDNSLKFTIKDQTPLIEIGFDKMDLFTRFWVKDNGIGIEENRLEKIFDLFEKINPDSEGKGIGLSLARRIVELHEGRIWAESAGLNQGTVIYFTLPSVLNEKSGLTSHIKLNSYYYEHR